MFMSLVGIVGFLAGMCTIVAFLPQVIKVVRTKDTESISIIFLIILIIGSMKWILYGIRIDKAVIFVANSSTFIMSSIILIYKVINIVQNKKKII